MGNVVTGIFVESAFATSAMDREFAVQEALQAKEQYARDVRNLFDEMDADHQGGLSLDELKKHLEDDSAKAYMKSLDLDFRDVEAMFKLLDVDNSGVIDSEEFLDGCERLRGEAKSIDIAMLMIEVRWLSRHPLDDTGIPAGPQV